MSQQQMSGARAHAQVSGELGNGYADVVAAADVALYGGLCALATLERPELRAAVVDNVAFREFLDAHPEARRMPPGHAACSQDSRCQLLLLLARRAGIQAADELLHVFACASELPQRGLRPTRDI